MTAPTLGRPDPGDVRVMAEHVDHEMERLLRVGDLLCRWRWLLHLLRLDTILRALRVAYAGHARALLEFFHDGRPGKDPPGGDRKARDGDFDVWLGDYTGTFDAHPWATSPPIHRDRLRDADKLLGHVSTGRLGLGGRPPWGDHGDRTWVRAAIVQVRTEVSAARRWHLFPETERALAETRC